MNNRKVSVDRNARQRTPTKRPSVSSLKARVNTMQQRIKSEKSPSTLNLSHAELKEPSHNVADYYVPKTRFTPQDRCKEFATSSPRLKYFPAEKIKKLDNSPAYTADPIGAIIMQQNPQESGTFYATGTADQNNGQGDTMTSLQPTSQQRQHQNMHTMSQQQVAGQQTVHHIGQNNSNSEPSLQQQVLSNQAHRPCVPHGEREYSPQKTAHPLYRNPPQNTMTPGPTNPMQQPLSVSGQTANPETCNVGNNRAECPDYDIQPVGGRNAALYRQTMSANQQPRLQSQMSMMPNVSQSNSSQQYQMPVQNHYPPQSQPPRYSTPQNPQLAYQQLQHTMAQQQQLQQRAMAYHMQMMSNDPRKNQEHPYGHSPQAVAQAPAQGMISPQEVNKNRNLPNYPPPQRTSVTTPRSAQLQPYSINVVNNQPQVFASSTQQQQQQQHLMAQYQQQQQQHLMAQYQQQQQQHLMAQYQQQQQQQHLMAQYQQPPVQPNRNSGHPLYRNPASVNESQQMMEQSGYNEQTSGRQMGQPNQEPPVDSRRDNEQKRAKLSFTPAMIRDQEKMVATMKQQGVPFDVIKRQFESLLNEQRRQLEYIEDLRRQDHMLEVERPVTTTRRRKQTDEKPEWMIHLTPSRLPYIVIEKMYEEQKEKERLAKQMDQTRQIQQNEMTNQLYQHNQQPCQHYRQESRQQPQQMSTKTRAIGSVQSSPNVPMMNYQHYQQHQNFPGYQQAQNAYLQQQNPEVQYQQVCQESPQRVESQVDPNNAAAHTTLKRATEPSSLLKLRMYKERIRPQGRNNGLQDPQIVRKYLEQWSQSADVQRGLEYLAGLEQKTRTARLNGLQERVEADHQLNERLMAVSSQQVPKRIPANGLENGRNPNNPPPQRLTQLKSADHQFLREYPRQKQNNPTNYYVQAERENGTVAVDEQPATSYGQQHLKPPTPMIPYNERNPTTARYNMMPFRFEGSCPQDYQQMQQYYRNARNLVRNTGEGDTESGQKNLTNNVGFDGAGGDATGNMNGQTADAKMPMYRTHYSQPDLHEARTIGGVRYLARKQDYMPNTQLVSPETLIASRNIQPPVIY